MEKAGRTLEFEKIKEQLVKFTSTIPGRQKAESLKPLTVLEEIEAMQRETSEAAALLLQKELAFKGCRDLLPSLQRAERGGMLDPTELKEIEQFLRALKTVKDYFYKEKEMNEKFPRIFARVMGLKLFPHLASQLEKCLDSQGEIRDNASPLLSSLRAEEKRLQEKIRQYFESYLRNPRYQKYLQENIVTIRHERYVLPVKQEYRNQVPGVVHDQSGSGVTLFIEPMPVLELNNRLRDIKGRIGDEIERILRMLTGLIADHYSELLFSYQVYGELDFILARGRLSIAHRGREPLLNNRQYIFIAAGRHPLLTPEDVVPVDVELGGDFHTLIITGPNTGGKTVTLKTIGLFTLMAQCGLHLPAGEGTELGIFETVWADIGDEQNIEQSLSTFSGHMTNIIEILRHSTSSSLVLLDELGSGTDPSEGSALAMAILHELHARGTRTVATTHINELKVFAHLQEGMENASMEFDPLTLSPTFRLLIGVPGQSNALDVAKRLGMPPELVEKARSYMKKDLLDLEEVVSGLVEERRRFSLDNEKIKEIKLELELRLRELEEEKKSMEKKRREILHKARGEANELVRSAQRKINEILKNLQRAEQEKRGKDALVAGEESRKEIKALLEEFDTDSLHGEIGRRSLKPEEIKEGQVVFVKSLRCPGEIIRILSEKEIQVQAGSLKINTAPGDLLEYKNDLERPARFNNKKKPFGDTNLMWEKSTAVKRSIDLRGLTLDEAILRVEKHLDDAALAGLDTIEIIHGKGTGKLRRGLHHLLEKKKQLESFRLGGEGEGGSGVTIVSLKK